MWCRQGQVLVRGELQKGRSWTALTAAETKRSEFQLQLQPLVRLLIFVAPVRLYSYPRAETQLMRVVASYFEFARSIVQRDPPALHADVQVPHWCVHARLPGDLDFRMTGTSL